MEWIDHVLVVAEQTQRRDTVIEQLTDRGIETAIAETTDEGLRLHDAQSVDVVLHTVDREPGPIFCETPGIRLIPMTSYDGAGDILDRLNANNELIAEQCQATFIHPTGETVTTEYGEVIVAREREALQVGRAAELPDWVYRDGVEVVANNRRDAVQTAFDVQYCRQKSNGMSTFYGTHEL